jgi:hypothetical protein
VLFQILDDRTNGEIDAALKIHWVHAGGNALDALLDDRGGKKADALPRSRRRLRRPPPTTIARSCRSGWQSLPVASQ